MSRPGGSKNNLRKPTEAAKSNERNEYIPSFIAKKPFYIDDATQSQSDYLEHQRLQSQKNHDPLATAQWYERGAAATAPKATKYRKGACENCGSMTHREKDCLQRKRKKGAKWTGKDIAADEKAQDVRLGWDAKRDRWNGFEASEYQGVVEEYNALEELRRKKDGEGEEGAHEDGVPAEEGTKYEEETDMGRQQSTSTRTLRMREDTAKYLLNLDLDSAKYDPKTRTMVDAAASDNPLIAEDGFQKASGDAAEFERAQRYAWETQERGGGDAGLVHLQANPTEAEVKRKRKAEDDLRKREERKKQLLEKYGDQSAVAAKPAIANTVAENERYVEYDSRGRIKGEKKKAEKSMYAEDVMINNHTSVWGSWWRDFKWGYACCHSTVKNSFCTGEEGIKASEESEAFSRGTVLALPEPSGEDVGVDGVKTVENESSGRDEANGGDLKASHVPNAPGRPERQVLDEATRRRREEEVKAGIDPDEMEKYRRERTSKTDPMAGILGKDELVEG
jgi:pre-mRNA-processing factor SLU7